MEINGASEIGRDSTIQLASPSMIYAGGDMVFLRGSETAAPGFPMNRSYATRQEQAAGAPIAVAIPITELLVDMFSDETDEWGIVAAGSLAVAGGACSWRWQAGPLVAPTYVGAGLYDVGLLPSYAPSGGSVALFAGCRGVATPGGALEVAQGDIGSATHARLSVVQEQAGAASILADSDVDVIACGRGVHVAHFRAGVFYAPAGAGTILGSRGVSSVVRSAAGDYEITLEPGLGFADTESCVLAMSMAPSGQNGASMIVSRPTATTIRVMQSRWTAIGVPSAAVDTPWCAVLVA